VIFVQLVSLRLFGRASRTIFKAMMASRLMLLVVVFALGLHSVVGAPVSVAMGIDLGTDNSVVALARKRGVDIIANEASQRSTPSIVSFGHDQRHVGEAGFSQRMMNVKNTVAEPKRLLGKLFSNQAFMDELKSEAYQVVEGEGGEIAVKVSLCGTERAFRPVQIISMLLANLRKIAETDHGAEVVDVAISVPLFFTEHQRRAILVAAEIAGLKCLRLINDNTATALAYGITKTDLPDKDARHVAFVDCGRDCMQVSVVAFTKGQLKVLSHTYTKKVCGRRIDGILFEHFASEFNDKYKIDARTQDRARLRLLVQCEKLKKTLSACPEDLETPINVECLMNDMDVCGMMNRIKLEELLNNEQVCANTHTLSRVNTLTRIHPVGWNVRRSALCNAMGSGLTNGVCVRRY
jgi:heat shock protein 4